MPVYAPQPAAQQQPVPGTVVTDPWDDELDSVIAELQALQEARAQTASAPEPVRYPMPSDDVPMAMQNALAGGGGGPIGPGADNALAFNPNPQANPYMSLRPMPGRTVLRGMNPDMPIHNVERTDPMAMEQREAEKWDTAKSLSGYNMGRAGVGNIGEGISEGDPLRVLGGGMQTGLALAPYGARYAGKLISSAMSGPWWKGPAVLGGAGLAAGPGAEGKLSADLSSGLQYMFGTPAEAAGKTKTAQPPAGPPPDDGLGPEQRTRRDQLISKLNRDGNLPRVEREELAGYNNTTSEYLRALGAGRAKAKEIEATEAAQRKAEADKAEAERQRREKEASTPTRERYADFMPYVVPTTMALAAGVGSATKALAASKFNTAINIIETRWKAALDRADKAKTTAGKHKAFDEAAELGVQFNALKKEGAGGNLKAALYGGGVGEVGYFLPEEIDMSRALMGSPLYEKTMKGLFPPDDPWNFPKRFAIGAGMGVTPAEVAGGLTSLAMKNRPVGYGPQTVALENALARAGVQTRAPQAAVMAEGSTNPWVNMFLPRGRQGQAPPVGPQPPTPTPNPTPVVQATPNPPVVPGGQGQRVLVQKTDALGRTYHVDPNSKYPGRRVSAPRQP